MAASSSPASRSRPARPRTSRHRWPCRATPRPATTSWRCTPRARPHRPISTSASRSSARPAWHLAGEGGRLSGEAYAGQDGQLTVVVRNDGSEAARDVEFSATAPEGWKTSFDPKQLPELAAGKSQPIKVSLTPSPRAIAGDYQTTIRANATGGQSESANFRITVLTSTLWGAVGIGIIALSLLVVVFAVARYGRR